MKKTLFAAALAVLMLAGCTPKEKKQANVVDNEEVDTLVTTKELAPDFILNDSEGKTFMLSSLRGKYVVLDFWGVWCKWCVKGIPDMKAYYEKYEGCFEMVSIDFGDDEDTWLNAINKYEMDWIHVITDEESSAQLQEEYGIEGFPTKVIIDPEGAIINVTVGEDPAFYKYLDELFGN